MATNLRGCQTGKQNASEAFFDSWRDLWTASLLPAVCFPQFRLTCPALPQHVDLLVGGVSGNLRANPVRQLNHLVDPLQFDLDDDDSGEHALVLVDVPRPPSGST